MFGPWVVLIAWALRPRGNLLQDSLFAKAPRLRGTSLQDALKHILWRSSSTSCLVRSWREVPHILG